MATTKRSTTYRLSERARGCITELAVAHGVSETDVVEMAVRVLARRDLPAGWEERHPEAPRRPAKIEKLKRPRGRPPKPKGGEAAS